MAFQLLPIEEQDAVLVHALAGSQMHAYGGKWAGDLECDARLFFCGCDVLDPTIPRWYRLLLGSEAWWDIQVLAAPYASPETLPAGAPRTFDTWLAVITPRSQSLGAPPEAMTVNALRVLERRPELQVMVVEKFVPFRRAQTPIPSHTQPQYGDPVAYRASPRAFAFGQRVGAVFRRLWVK